MEEAADAAHSTQVERAAQCATMPPPLKICSRACAVCACLKRLVSEASGPRVSGCLPRANLRRVHRASCED